MMCANFLFHSRYYDKGWLCTQTFFLKREKCLFCSDSFDFSDDSDRIFAKMNLQYFMRHHFINFHMNLINTLFAPEWFHSEFCSSSSSSVQIFHLLVSAVGLETHRFGYRNQKPTISRNDAKPKIHKSSRKLNSRRIFSSSVQINQCSASCPAIRMESIHTYHVRAYIGEFYEISR